MMNKFSFKSFYYFRYFRKSANRFFKFTQSDFTQNKVRKNSLSKNKNVLTSKETGEFSLEEKQRAPRSSQKQDEKQQTDQKSVIRQSPGSSMKFPQDRDFNILGDINNNQGQKESEHKIKNQTIKLGEQQKEESLGGLENEKNEITRQADLAQIHCIIHEIANLGVIVYDNSGNLMYYNDTILEVFESSPDQILEIIEKQLTSNQTKEELTDSRSGKVNGLLEKKSIANFKDQLQQEYKKQVSMETPQNSNDSLSYVDNFQSIQFIGDHQFEQSYRRLDSSQYPSKKFLMSKRSSEETLKILIEILEECIRKSIDKKTKSKNFEKGFSDSTFLSVMKKSFLNNHNYNKQKKHRKNNHKKHLDQSKQDLKVEISINRVPYRMKIGVTSGLSAPELLMLVFEQNTEQLEKRKQINLLSHQLRSPLNCSIGLLEILQNTRIDPEIKQRFVLPSLTSNYYLLNNLNMIIDLMELENKEFKYEIQRVSIKSLFTNAINMLHEQAQMKNVTINFEMDIDVDEIWSDSKRIKQVLLNLLSNAIQFSHPNGQIDIKLANRIDESSERQINLNKQNQVFEIQEEGEEEVKRQTPSQEFQNSSYDGNESGLGKFDQIEAGIQSVFNRSVNFSVPEKKVTNQIKVQIQDYGIGIQQTRLEEIINENHDLDLLTVSDEDLRSQGFGIKSAAMILKGLRDRSHQGFPLKISSEVDQGCCYQFKLMDFIEKIGVEDHLQRNKLRRRSGWVDYNLTEQKMFLEQKSVNFENQPNVEITSFQFLNDEIPAYFEEFSSEFVAQENEENQENFYSNINRSIEKQLKGSLNTKDFEINGVCLNFNNNSCLTENKGKIQNDINSHDRSFNEILIVDDNQFNLLTLEYIFEELERQVDKSFNGLQAVEAFVRKFEETGVPFQLIFMDIDMPVKNGFQASKEIMDFCQIYQIDTVIVACTAFLGPEDMERAKKSGMKEYVSQPVSQDLIKDVVLKYFPR